MLTLLRNKKVQKQIYIVLAIAVIASFGVSGILISHDNNKSSSSVGTIYGKKISVQDYLASYKAVDHQARVMYGNAFDQVRSYINFKSEAWDRLLLLSYAKKQGFRASDNEVVDWIGRQPFLQTKGEFDPRAYKMFTTEYLHVEPKRFEEEVRELLTIGKIQEKMEAGLKVSDEEIRRLYTQERGEREIEYLILPSPAENTLTVTDEELQQIYPLYQGGLKEPAKVKIRYLFVPKEKQAELKELLADENASLEGAATKSGLKIAESDYFSKNETIPGLGLVSEVIDKSFSLKPHETSGWISSATGSSKIEVIDQKAAKALTFEESKEQLKTILARQRSVEASLKKLKELAKDLKTEDFEKFAAGQKLEVKSMKQFKDGAYVPGIGPSQTIQRQLAAVKEGGISAPIPVPGGAAIVKVIKTTLADEKKFEAEKADFRKKILNDKAQAEMTKLLENLRKELSPNVDLMKEIFPEEEKQ